MDDDGDWRDWAGHARRTEGDSKQASATGIIRVECNRIVQWYRNGASVRSTAFRLEVEDPYAALPITGCVQCAQRRASMGISLKHSGHFLVVGSGGLSPRFMRATSVFTGKTTKK